MSVHTIKVKAYKGDSREPYEALQDAVPGDYEQLYKKKTATHAVCIYSRNEKGKLRQETHYYKKI